MFTISATREPLEQVKKSLLEFFDENNIKISEEETSEVVQLVGHNGWSYVRIQGHMTMPKLVLHLSISLDTMVFTLSEFSQVGALHYSVVESGEAKQLYSALEIVDEIKNINLREIFNEAKKEGLDFTKRKFAPGSSISDSELKALAAELFSYASEADLLNMGAHSRLIDKNWEEIYLDKLQLPEYYHEGPNDTWEDLKVRFKN